MIKFFRKIRQELIAKNKVSKYLLYAIGEIILVVLGILIALQINNRNEHQKNLKAQVNILTQLNSDLKANLEEITTLQSANARKLEAGEKYLQYLSLETADSDSMKIWISQAQTRNIANFNNTTYRNIQSKGETTISNDSLRISISAAYDSHFYNIEKRMELETKALDRFEILVSKRFKRSTILIPGQNPLISINTPIDIYEIQKDEEFLNVFFILNNMRRIRQFRLPPSVNALEELIKNIDIEIAKLNK